MSTPSKQTSLSNEQLTQLQLKAKTLKTQSKQLRKELRTTYVKAVGEIDVHEEADIRQTINALTN